MTKKAIVIGGTGATGRHLIKQLIVNDSWEQITSIGRRSVLDGGKYDKLQDVIVENLHDLSSTKQFWNGNDVFFNCIGTTRKRSGSAKNFVEIEVDISKKAAKMAADAKISHASVISAQGANHNQWAKDWIHPLFYMKTIGEKEQTLIDNDFNTRSIFRPGMLIRLMDDESWFEHFMRVYRFGLRVGGYLS